MQQIIWMVQGMMPIMILLQQMVWVIDSQFLDLDSRWIRGRGCSGLVVLFSRIWCGCTWCISEIEVNFSAVDLEGGDYALDITITSNGKDEPTVTVPVTMSVDPLYADISVAPESLNEELLEGETSTQVLTITNSGTSVLTGPQVWVMMPRLVVPGLVRVRAQMR